MAAGLGFKTFTSGEVLTAADTNGYLMQGILVFANASARTAAITSPQEGQDSYLNDTNSTEYYDGSAWVAGVEGDISGVTAGVGISGGGTSGTVTVTNSMATTITTKGDLVPGTGSGTFSRLAVGNNGETLLADSAATTGLRYSATPSASNPVLNSSFQIAQRGTSFTVTSAQYTLDRWYAAAATNTTVTQQATSDTTNLPFIQKCVRVQRTAAATSTDGFNVSQSMETINSIPYAGKTVTLSVYARKGANYSATSSLMYFRLYTGTGTDQQIAVYTGASITADGQATLTTTWQRFTITATVPTTATELGVLLLGLPTGTAGAADYFEVTGVQIDVGSVALPFRTNAGTIQGELAACMRYFFKPIGGQIGIAQSTVEVYVTIPNVMRAAPTVVTPATAVNLDRYGVGSYTQSSAAVVSSGTYASANAVAIIYTNFTGLTAGIPYAVTTSGGSVTLSSEL